MVHPREFPLKLASNHFKLTLNRVKSAVFVL